MVFDRAKRMFHELMVQLAKETDAWGALAPPQAAGAG
jgi:hypothetical protein